MNRRDQLRLDDRRRKSHPLKEHTHKHSDLTYFDSQKVIQSVVENPTAVKTTKSFRIPKKQPTESKSEEQTPSIETVSNSNISETVECQKNQSNWKTKPTDRPKTDVFKPSRFPKTTKKNPLKRRFFFNKPTEIIIADRSAPNGKISPENAEMFLNEIQDSIMKRILNTDLPLQAKLIDYKHDDSGLITMTCADEFTSVYIREKVKENLPLWPGAKLEWSYGYFNSCFIDLIVPHSIGHISQFLQECKKTNSRMQTDKWRRIECENAEDDSGILFKLAVDRQSYEIMKNQDNVLYCGKLKIKVKLDETVEETLASAK